VRDDLRKSLAVCLANWAAQTTDKAMAVLTPDEAAHVELGLDGTSVPVAGAFMGARRHAGG
jgi:hypothetical protein